MWSSKLITNQDVYYNESDIFQPLFPFHNEEKNIQSRRRIVKDEFHSPSSDSAMTCEMSLKIPQIPPIKLENNEDHCGVTTSNNKRMYKKRLSINFMKVLKSYVFPNRKKPFYQGIHEKYYKDNFNDQSYNCSIGNSEKNGIWMNQSDKPGTIMAFMVWVLLGYSAITITFLAKSGGVHSFLSMLYVLFCSLALAAHAKTQFTDPGCVPPSAQPIECQRNLNPQSPLTMCSQCQTFKPPLSHHCRICNRCISRMDHHCPWMNNCIGAGNLKHFMLFLFYTWLCSMFSLGLLGWNYFFCIDDNCTFSNVMVQLSRLMTILSTGALLFTSSMIMNVIYGVVTGIGTIDRLKKKATNTMMISEERSIPISHIFGISGYHTWFFPVDPVFEDYDAVMGFSTPQRLLREQLIERSMCEFYEKYSFYSNNSEVISKQNL